MELNSEFPPKINYRPVNWLLEVEREPVFVDYLSQPSLLSSVRYVDFVFIMYTISEVDFYEVYIYTTSHGVAAPSDAVLHILPNSSCA